MQSRFDLRLANTPPEWRDALVEVIDTADAVRLALEDLQIDSPELLLGLTRLVIDRHDKQKQESLEEG